MNAIKRFIGPDYLAKIMAEGRLDAPLIEWAKRMRKDKMKLVSCKCDLCKKMKKMGPRQADTRCELCRRTVSQCLTCEILQERPLL